MTSGTARFEGKGVVVTGAAQGIGRAVAKEFAAEGAGVVLVDNEADVLAATVESIRESGGNVEAAPGDVSRRADVRRAVPRRPSRGASETASFARPRRSGSRTTSVGR